MTKTTKKEGASATKGATGAKTKSEDKTKSAAKVSKASKPAKVAAKPTEAKVSEKKPAKRATSMASPSPEAKPRTRRAPVRTAQVTTEQAAPSPGEIAQRAYELYLERGGNHGRDIDDWLEAERQLTGTHS